MAISLMYFLSGKHISNIFSVLNQLHHNNCKRTLVYQVEMKHQFIKKCTYKTEFIHMGNSCKISYLCNQVYCT